jgi:hypothetical protein
MKMTRPGGMEAEATMRENGNGIFVFPKSGGKHDDGQKDTHLLFVLDVGWPSERL